MTEETEDDKKLVGNLRDRAEIANGRREMLLFLSAAARIESLAAEVERVTKERDSLQQQLRQIRGTDQWRD